MGGVGRNRPDPFGVLSAVVLPARLLWRSHQRQKSRVGGRFDARAMDPREHGRGHPLDGDWLALLHAAICHILPDRTRPDAAPVGLRGGSAETDCGRATRELQRAWKFARKVRKPLNVSPSRRHSPRNARIDFLRIRRAADVAPAVPARTQRHGVSGSVRRRARHARVDFPAGG